MIVTDIKLSLIADGLMVIVVVVVRIVDVDAVVVVDAVDVHDDVVVVVACFCHFVMNITYNHIS